MIEEGIEEVMELEQDIMSGVDSQRCEPLQPESLLKRVQKFVADACSKDKQDLAVRIVTILLSYYDVPDKPFQDMLKKVGQMSDHGQALTMLKQAISAKSAKNEKVKKIRRSLPTLDELSKSKYRS